MRRGARLAMMSAAAAYYFPYVYFAGWRNYHLRHAYFGALSTHAKRPNVNVGGASAARIADVSRRMAAERMPSTTVGFARLTRLECDTRLQAGCFSASAEATAAAGFIVMAFDIIASAAGLISPLIMKLQQNVILAHFLPTLMRIFLAVSSGAGGDDIISAHRHHDGIINGNGANKSLAYGRASRA